MTHGQSQAQFGYLVTFVLALFIAGCGGGGESSDISSVSANELEVVAAPGQILVVTVGDTATLNGSSSTTSSGESVTYAWSFRSKPHGSTATLDDPASATPTFIADLKGTYTVELVVSARGVVDSRSNIAYVEAVLDKTLALNTPLLRNHERSNSWCFECHIKPTSVVEKSGDHIASSNMCQACHSIFAFSPIFFADHDELIIDNCQECHDGVAAIGKSDSHVTTQADCETCHELNACNSFLNVNLGDCSYNHTGITRNCDQCHVGGAAVGKDADHLETSSDCINCHTTTEFIPATFSDEHALYTEGCGVDGCHGANDTFSQPDGHPDTIAVLSIGTECIICHNTQSFNMGGIFDHGTVLSRELPCKDCHEGNGTDPAIATVKDQDHLDNLGADCGNCHKTTAFLPPFIDHTSDAVMYITDPNTGLPDTNPPTPKACASCHNGTDAPGINANHLPTATDCGGVDGCHTPGTFTSGVFDHTPAKTTVTLNAGATDAIAGNCTACHNNSTTAVVSGLPNNHVPTNNAECDVCHTDTKNYTTFAGAVFDHSTIVPPTQCSDCHDGNIATGVTRDHVPIGNRDCSDCHTYTVEATFTGGFFDHTGITGTCDTCHGSSHDFGTDANNNDIVGTKPRGTHVPTTADCGDCHDYSVGVGFTSTTKFMSNVHANITDGCGGCHREVGRTDRLSTSNGIVPGKDTNTHVPTNQDCDACHTTTDPFTTATFSHLGITGDCKSCHDGQYASIGATIMPDDENHQVTGTGVPITADCGICHSTDTDPGTGAPSFTYKVFDHTGNITNCAQSGCHGGTAPTATVEPNDTIHTNSLEDCSVCHVPGTFATAVFSHDGITDNCASCHGNAPTATFAPDDAIHNTTTQDCSACHNTTGFANAQFNHGSIEDNCVACHGDTAIGKPAIHVPTNDDCHFCHKTTGFTPATFNHDGITTGCIDCHDGDFATGKPAIGHPTTNADCGACHAVDGQFLDGQMDHTGITVGCNQAGCHGDGATGKDAKTNPAHLDTDLDCYRCHTTATFSGGSWVHGQSDTDCRGCHNGTNATGKPPEGRNGHFTTTEQCSGCHTTNRWAPANEYNHQNGSDYPGEHNRTKTCAQCHKDNNANITYGSNNRYNGNDYVGTCASCHYKDYEADSAHNGNRTLAENTTCSGSRCHNFNGQNNRAGGF